MFVLSNWPAPQQGSHKILKYRYLHFLYRYQYRSSFYRYINIGDINDSSTHKWITSWPSGRFQKVVLDGQASDPVQVLSGVPQGSVLGPVLFLIFINDLPENIRSSVRLFADDCVLYRNIESPMDCQILQDDLNSLAQWETDWQMKFNVAKCHSMRVTWRPPDKHIEFDYTLHQQRLEQVQSTKYLGLTITNDLDWGQHISEISAKATKTMGFRKKSKWGGRTPI